MQTSAQVAPQNRGKTGSYLNWLVNLKATFSDNLLKVSRTLIESKTKFLDFR